MVTCPALSPSCAQVDESPPRKTTTARHGQPGAFSGVSPGKLRSDDMELREFRLQFALCLLAPQFFSILNRWAITSIRSQVAKEARTAWLRISHQSCHRFHNGSATYFTLILPPVVTKKKTLC